MSSIQESQMVQVEEVLICSYCGRNEKECEEQTEEEKNPITDWCGWGLSCDDCYYKNHTEEDEEDESVAWCYENDKNAICRCMNPCYPPSESEDEEDEEDDTDKYVCSQCENPKKQYDILDPEGKWQLKIAGKEQFCSCK